MVSHQIDIYVTKKAPTHPVYRYTTHKEHNGSLEPTHKPYKYDIRPLDTWQIWMFANFLIHNCLFSGHTQEQLIQTKRSLYLWRPRGPHIPSLFLAYLWSQLADIVFDFAPWSPILRQYRPDQVGFMYSVCCWYRSAEVRLCTTSSRKVFLQFQLGIYQNGIKQFLIYCFPQRYIFKMCTFWFELIVEKQ